MNKDDEPAVTLKHWQVEQLKLIGELIRGDWSGLKFDGRNIRNWIDETLNGKDIRKNLKEIQDEY